MANHNPDISGLVPFKKGQSGNPKGYSRGRRVSDALGRFLDRIDGADDDLARTIFAMATGRKIMLKDGKEDSGKRTPEIAWLNALMDRIEGKVADKLEVSSDEPKPQLRLPETDDRYSEQLPD